MMRILTKKTLIIFMIILFIITIIAFSCALNDIKKIAEDPDFKTVWDVDARIPVFEKDTEPISLKKYVEDKALSISTPDLAILLPGSPWPIASDPLGGPVNGNIPINTDIDIDGGGTDFTLEGYYATRTDLLELRVWLTNAGGTILPINSYCIDIEQIVIENINCDIGTPVNQNNILVYTSNNFLDPTQEYYLALTNTGLANQLDYTIEFQLVVGGGPTYAADNYTLHFVLVLDLGSDFSIVGRVTDKTPLPPEQGTLLFGIDDQKIPIGDIPAEKLNNFKLEFEYTSNLPINLNSFYTFNGSDQIPSPDTFNPVIASGNLSPSTYPATPNEYYYVSSLNKSKNDFKFNDNVLKYGDMTLDIKFRLPITGVKIRLDMDTLIKVKIVASAEATISL